MMQAGKRGEMAAIKGVITTIGKMKLCEAHAGVRTLAPITQMAFGDGGVDENGTPKTVTGDETALYNELLRKNVGELTFPNDEHTTCRYPGILGDDELVGEEISELALYDSEGDMIMIQTFLKKGKDEGISQTYEVDEIF